MRGPFYARAVPQESKKVVFVLETYDYPAVTKYKDLNPESVKILESVAEGLDVTVCFAITDPTLAGRAKSKVGMKRIRKARPELLDAIDAAKPDVVICFGPTATACVFDHGSLPQGEMFRKAHYPLSSCTACNGSGCEPDSGGDDPFGPHPCAKCQGKDGPPVYVTVGLSATRWKAGLQRWLRWDVEAAINGWSETEWGNYTILLPGTPEWDKGPFTRVLEEGRVVWFNEEHKSFRDVGFDLETYPGTDPWHPDSRIRMAVISDRVGRAWVIQATPDSRLPQWVYDLVEDPNVRKSGSNIKFDYLWMRRHGCRMVNMWDTSTHEHIIDESNPRKDLKSLTFIYVPKLADYSRGQRELIVKRGGWEHILDEEMYQYAGGDGEASIGAALGQMPQIEAKFERPAHLFRRLYDVLAEMEHNGAAVDLDVTRELDELYGEKLAALRQKIVEALGPVNPNSPTAMAKALKAAIPGINLKLREWTRIMSNDEDEEVTTKRIVLERESHLHPIISVVLEYRSYRTRHSTFIKGILEDSPNGKRKAYGRHHSGGVFIHPSFHTDRVETFRLSSSRPNGQNYPKDDPIPELSIKRQFVSRFEGGEIMEADLSQIEIRFAAWLSQDENMLKAIESGEDIHTSMAALMLDKPASEVTDDERQTCKARTFLILYGGGAGKLAADLKIPRRRAEKLITEYFRAFYGLKDFIDRTHEEVHRTLEVVSPFGFTRRFVRPLHWDSSEGWSIQRQAFNMKGQNGAACITYCAMIWLQGELERRKLKSLLILQVHDSLVTDVYPGERTEIAALLRTAMEVEARRMAREDYKVDLDVMLQCDIKVGKSWGDTQPLEDKHESQASGL